MICSLPYIWLLFINFPSYVNKRAERRQRDYTCLTPEVMTTLFENIVRERRGESRKRRGASTTSFGGGGGGGGPNSLSAATRVQLSVKKAASAMKAPGFSHIITDSVRERNENEEDNDDDISEQQQRQPRPNGNAVDATTPSNASRGNRGVLRGLGIDNRAFEAAEEDREDRVVEV